MKPRIAFPDAKAIEYGSCRVLAEAGQCMEGSIDKAIEMARDAATAGAWGIKTQLLRPETIATANAGKYWDDAFGTSNQREAFTAAGLIDYDRWGPVRDVCREIGLAFVATPFDLEAVDALESIDVDAYKVASGDLLFVPMLDKIVDTGRPILLSTGAAWADEVESAVERMATRDSKVFRRLVLLACSLVYPTPIEEANVGRIGRLREMAIERQWGDVLVGYSDHTTATSTARDAAAAGAVLVEKHYTSRNPQGQVADHSMAVDPDGLHATVVDARRGAMAFGDPTIVPTDAECRAREGARRGMYMTRNAKAGDIVRATDAVALRPCPEHAVPPDIWYEAAGSMSVYRQDVAAGDVVVPAHLDLLL